MTTKLAVIFPGQGSQAVNMMSAWAHSEIVRAVFDEAADVLAYDLWSLVCDGPEEKLNQTEYTQVALLTAGVALWRTLFTPRNLPSYVAGHSLGEYTALVCSQALSFSEALLLVQKRARFMQEAVPAGTGMMAAILGLENATVGTLCERASEPDSAVFCANFNSPGQVVVAGHKAAVERLMLSCREAKARRVVPLNVSVPSHCPLMQVAADKLAPHLDAAQFQMPKMHLIQNNNAQRPQTLAQLSHNLKQQLVQAVQWTQTIEQLDAAVDVIIECGPGQVLTGLNKRLLHKAKALNFREAQEFSRNQA